MNVQDRVKHATPTAARRLNKIAFRNVRKNTSTRFASAVYLKNCA